MKLAIAALVLLLVALHHDFWFWEDSSLVLGFLPVGMAYHIGISLAAAVVWFLAIRFAWPIDGQASADPKDGA